jgi:hypothetical protein
MNFKILIFTKIFIFFHLIIEKILQDKKKSIKWFTNHVFTNTLIVLMTYRDIINLLNCKENCLELEQTGGILKNDYVSPPEMIVSATSALHLYHVICFSNLRLIDYMHHYLMLVVLAMSYIFQAGCYQSMFMFFLSGLPGLIDYSLLALKVDRKTEKKINLYLNNYLRSPGIIFTTGLYWRDTTSINFWSILIGYGLLFWNATYFNLDVIRSYYTYTLK